MPAHEVQRFPSAKTRAIIEITSLEAGSPWRTGDGQLGKLSGPLPGQGFFGGGSRNGITQYADLGFGFDNFTLRRPLEGGPAYTACAAQTRWHAAGRRFGHQTCPG